MAIVKVELSLDGGRTADEVMRLTASLAVLQDVLEEVSKMPGVDTGDGRKYIEAGAILSIVLVDLCRKEVSKMEGAQ